MGKKRNNATKKKQTAKKKRLSSAYGVSVLKGGTTHSSKQSNANATSSSNICNNNGQSQKQKKPISGESGVVANVDIHAKLDHSITSSSSVQQQPGKRQRNSNGGENVEFHRLHASLEERSLALQSRNNELRRVNKNGRQQKKKNKKGWGNFVGPSSSIFAPPTLTLAPKTTAELIDDAANQVAIGMNEIGQQSMTTATANPLVNDISSATTAIPGQSSLAAAASLNWKLRVSNVSSGSSANNQIAQTQQQQYTTASNPYAALDIDSDSDDDDNEWSDKKRTKIVQQFQFKPASFSCQSTLDVSTNHTSSSQVMGAATYDEIDPDL